MAKCDLSIELDHPDRDYQGGELITGRVRVRVDSDVKCKGLEVASAWRTHGRGNIANGISKSISVFSGEWKSGTQAEYRFELPVAAWPPSYHGHFLSIDHYIDAHAKIPWGIDPKASVPFFMKPSSGSKDSRVGAEVITVNSVIGSIIGVVMLGCIFVFFGMLFTMGPLALFFLLVPSAGIVYWFFRKFLPKYALGEVICDLHIDTVSPGQTVMGELTIRPRKAVSINAITAQFRAKEQCVSGSGSNRRTHEHVFFEKVVTLQTAVQFEPGQEYRFPIELTLPDDAPYTVDLDDNCLIWDTTVCVDIPRWPDWVEEIPVTVVPADQAQEGAGSPLASPLEQSSVQQAHRTAAPVGMETEEDVSGSHGITFQETVRHLWSMRDRRDQVEQLVEAVTGLSFHIEAEIERRLLYGGDEDPHVYPDGYAVWARYTDPALPMVLYVPHELADEFEQMGRDVWHGTGMVVGWDSLHGRLQIKLDRAQTSSA